MEESRPKPSGESEKPGAAGPAGSADGASEGHAIARGSGLFAAGTMVSRVLGLVRDILIVPLKGGVADAFLYALTVPNLARQVFGEGALTHAFTPVYVERVSAGDARGASRTASVVLTWLLLVLGTAALLGSAVCYTLASGAPATGEGRGLVLALIALMLPYMPLICAFAFLMAVLNSHRRFAPGALAPALLNLCLIGVFVLRWPERAEASIVWWLAGAVLLAGVLQPGVEIPFARAAGFRYRPSLDTSDPGFRKVVAALVTVAPAAVLFELNVFIDRTMAIALVPGEGAVRALYAANRLAQLPMAVLGTALATAALPIFSSQKARGDDKGLRESLTHAVRLAVFTLVPAGLLLAVCGRDVIRLLFERGAFTYEDTTRALRVLLFAAGGLAPLACAAVCARVFFARRRMRPPAVFAAVAVGVNIALDLVLVHTPLREAGLALASAIAAAVYLALLWGALAREDASPVGAKVLGTLGRALLAGGAAMLAAHWTERSLPWDAPPGDLFVLAQRAIAPVLLGLVAYTLVASFFYEEGEMLRSVFPWRRRKKKAEEKDKNGKGRG